MAEIFGYPIMGGGGSSGGTLTVAGVAGSTVTVSNADKSYTRTLDSTGKAIFKGLASGTWTVTMTNGTQTATRSVEITADYSVSIAYFAATINVTYPAGSMCTATDGVTTLTAPNTTGTWKCIVPNAGTWTINCTDGSLSTSRSISITAAGETKTLTLSYIRYLYNSGDQCTDITGGWTTDGVVYGTNGVYTNGGISFTDTAIRMTRQNVRGNIPAVSTVNKVDLSEFETLKVNFDLSVGGTQFRIYVSNAKSPYDVTAVASQFFNASVGNDQTATLDVSGVNTSVYIVLCSFSGNEYVAFTQDIKIIGLI